jgi:hypothetical protein
VGRAVNISRDDVLGIAAAHPCLETLAAEIFVRLNISEVDLWLAGMEGVLDA